MSEGTGVKPTKYEYEKGVDWFTFEGGEVQACTSYGCCARDMTVDLSKKETRKLYEAMKAYYEGE